MHRILAIIHFDGRPIDKPLLANLATGMATGEPDEQRTDVVGSTGLASLAYHTTFESRLESQPFRSDTGSWIVADARIDGQADLRAKLSAKGIDAKHIKGDAELILRSYEAWGEECLQYLIGDFAFVIWDGRNRKVFSARDQIGARAFSGIK